MEGNKDIRSDSHLFRDRVLGSWGRGHLDIWELAPTFSAAMLLLFYKSVSCTNGSWVLVWSEVNRIIRTMLPPALLLISDSVDIWELGAPLCPSHQVSLYSVSRV